MPKKRASLASEGEVVDIVLPRLYRALSDICWPIRPTGSKLPYSMPAITKCLR